MENRRFTGEVVDEVIDDDEMDESCESPCPVLDQVIDAPSSSFPQM